MKTTRETLLDDIKHIPTLLQHAEQLLLWDLAQEVPPGGTILEIGACYGGSTAILGLANPKAKITTIDWFQFHPYGDTSAKILFDNLASVGVKNVTLREGDSTKMTHDGSPIDLLWIDGGHHRATVLHDLQTFGASAKVIAMHDFSNKGWKGVREAYDAWHKRYKQRIVVQEVHWTAVIRFVP